MAKVKKTQISCLATISEKAGGIAIGAQSVDLRFNQFHVEDGDIAFMRQIVDEKSLIRLSLSYPENAKFEVISCECGVKTYKMGSSADTPVFAKMAFSDGQIIALRGIQKSGDEIKVTIERLQGTFDFEGESEGDDE
jgi:hypothetical protein